MAEPSPVELQAFGEALLSAEAAKPLREAYDRSLGDVARDAEVSVSTVWNYEHGCSRPTGDAGLRWARTMWRLASMGAGS